MKIIGFNLSKISAEKLSHFKKGRVRESGINFTDIDKEKADFLKEGELLKVAFNHSLKYSDPEDKKSKDNASIDFEGVILMTGTKDELKDIPKLHKKQKLPAPFQQHLFNVILKKCTAKTLQLQDELNLPSHLPIPQVRTQKKE